MPTYVYRFTQGSFTPAPGSGQFVGYSLVNGTLQPQLGSDPLLERVTSGVANYLEGHSVPTISPLVTSTISRLDAKLDSLEVLGDLLAGQLYEAQVRFGGVVGEGLGAAGGAGAMGIFIAAGLGASLTGPVALVAMGGAAFFGGNLGEDIGRDVAGSQWIHSNAPPVPAGGFGDPTLIVNGIPYFVALANDSNGVPRAFVYTQQSGPINGNSFQVVTDLDVIKRVVDGTLTNIGFDPSISYPQYRVQNGQSPSGLDIGVTRYYTNGPEVTDSMGGTSRPVFRIDTYRDPETGAAMEIRLSGEIRDGVFHATPNTASVIGMDRQGRVVLGEPMASSIAGNLASSIAGTDVARLMPGAVTSVSIQNHPAVAADSSAGIVGSPGAQSIEFRDGQGNIGWLLPNGEAGYTFVLSVTNGSGGSGDVGSSLFLGRELADGRRVTTMVMNLDANRRPIGLSLHTEDGADVTQQLGDELEGLLPSGGGEGVHIEILVPTVPPDATNRPVSGSAWDYEGVTYVEDSQGLWVSNLGGSDSSFSQRDIIDPITGQRWLERDGVRIPVPRDSTIVITDGGQATVAERAPPLRVLTTPTPSTQVLDDGSSITTTRLPGDLTRTVARDSDGNITGIVEEQVAGTVRTTRVLDGAGNLIETQQRQGFDDGSSIESVARPDGSEVRITRNPDGTEHSRVVVASYADAFGAAIQDAFGLVNAIRSGEPLPIAASGLRFLNTLDRQHEIPGLGATSAVANGVVSLYNLANALENGNALDQVYAAGNALVAVNNAMTALNNGVAVTGTLNTVASNIAPALPVLGAIIAIANGDYVGAAVGLVAAYFLPVVGWIYAAYQIIEEGQTATAWAAGSVFNEPPEAWAIGSFRFANNSTELSFDVQGESLGINRVHLLMEGNGEPATLEDGSANPEYLPGLQGYLDEIVALATEFNPDEPLGVIPQRLPSLTWREARQGDPGYAVTDIDPLTGEQRYPFLRYNDDWTPYNADPTDAVQRRSLFERLVYSAIDRGAIAPMWEVQTARLQQDAGDPLAGLTEEERAARRGLLSPLDPLTNQHVAGTFRPVALDLDGDGRITTIASADTDRCFDWDGSGFDKEVGWVGSGEGVLFLDRDSNGVLSSGRELFSNSLLADPVKGVRSLAWVDANGDGVVNSIDPVYRELWVWQDANGDARTDAQELRSLGDLGITELDYTNQRFTRNGEYFSLQSPELETDAEGQRISIVPDGIRVESSNGEVQVYATSVLDASRRPRVANVSDGSAVEGGAVDFTVTLNMAGAAATTVALGVQAASADTADLALPIEVSFNGGQTYVAVVGGVVDVPAGVSQFVARVRTADDASTEPLETFTFAARARDNVVAITGTGSIVDNDAPSVQLAITGPSSATESAGTLIYSVSLTQAAASTVTVNYTTAAGAAQSGGDFTGASGTLTFAPGETIKTFTVAVVDDAAVEFSEGFSVVLSDATGATIAVPSVQTTIQDDDTPGDTGGGDPGTGGSTFVAGDDDLGVKSEDFSDAPTTTPATGVILWDLLLANDSFNGSPSGLSITSVGNGQHVNVTLDATNRTVHVTPQANYNGQASFQYAVQSPDGQVRTATAFLTFAPVNDLPTVSVELGQRPIYGWGPLVQREMIDLGGDNGSAEQVTITADQGVPFYEPFNTVAGRQMQQVLVGFGQDRHYEWREAGPVVDTGIPQSYFDAEWARSYQPGGWNGDSYTEPVTHLEFMWNGQRYRVQASPATYRHDTPIAQEQNNDGRVVTTDIEGSIGFRYEVVEQPLYGRLGGDGAADDIDATTGAFTYTGRRYVPTDEAGHYVGQNVYTDQHARGEAMFDDQFIVRVTDLSDNTSTLQTIDVPHYGPRPSPDVQNGGKKPIAIDLNGDGFHFTDVDDSNVFYNVNADGWRRRIAWNNPSDGFIAYDNNGDGKIEQFDELSFVPYNPDGRTDLEGLRAFDTNGDGIFSAADEKWASFGVWQDANANGVSDPGEFRSLTDLGIQSVALTSDGQFRVIDGQTVHGTAMATRTDGSTLSIADVTLRYRNETLLTEADGSTHVVPAPNFQTGTTFEGTPDKDLALGTSGSDTFRMRDGDDVVMDDLGNDGVEAGAGNDLVYTGADVDIIDAGAGNDVVFAGHGNDLLFGVDGDDLLMAEGGNDVAFGGAGHDFIGGGDGNDILSGDAGDDRVFGEQGWDALFGQEGNDELWGLDGNDLLYGGDGNDLLAGGEGEDRMEGGLGHDTYEVDAATDQVVELENAGEDGVHASISYTLASTLENLTLTGSAALQGIGNGANNVLVGNAGNNTLQGLAGNDTLDGGAGADVLTGGVGDDIYIVDNAGDEVREEADGGNDTTRSRISQTLAQHVENLELLGIGAIDGTGNALDNHLVGNVSANALNGGVGADVMVGGGGNDRYQVDNAGDQVVEAAGEGYDTVTVTGLASYVLSDNVEALLLGSGVADGYGNESGNALIGNAEANRLDGRSGADVMAGGGSDDTYVVDDANDLVLEQAAAGIDTVESSVGHALATNVENLTLTGDAVIDATGNTLNNVLRGNSAANHLDGGAGADVMQGGAGNDTYVVDDAGDAVIELADAGIDTVFSSVSQSLSGGVEHLVLSGADAIDGTGNELANVLVGNAAANRLDGGAAADTMRGGAGNDVYVVDNAADAVVELAGEGTDEVLSAVTHGLAVQVENLTLTGSQAIDGTGNELDNTLTGNSGGNRLDGAAGADSMAGGAGDDTYVVDSDGDVVTEDADAGIDLVESSVSYALTPNVENLTLTGDAAIDATGNTLNNVLTGNAASNRLDGGRGADALSGGAGDDTYVVDNASDAVIELADGGIDTVLSSVSHTLSANVENLTLTDADAIDGTGNDLANVLAGNAAANRLDGASGADQMLGGAGNDTYIVDDAADTVIELAGEGIDSVYASISQTLAAQVENLTLTGTADIDANGNELDNVLIGNTGRNRLDGAAGVDVMAGGAGDDTYIVDNAGDFVVEAADEGIEQVESSVSHALTSNVENLALTGVAAIDATGNSLDNVLAGNVAANRIDGGTGADTMLGGAGNDTYVVDHAADLVVEVAGEGTERVEASVSHALTSHVENLTLTGTADIDGTGNELENTLVGNSGRNRLDGGAGADVMSGAAGDDAYVVDHTGDAVIELESAGFDQVFSGIDYVLPQHVEQLTLTGSAIRGTGNALDNLLFGNEHANVLDGAAGADRMTGGAGDDRYVVDNVGDTAIEAANGGNDTVYAAATHTLGANVEGLVLTGAAAIDGSGNELANVLVGNSAGNVLSGQAGNDVLAGGTGNDRLDGGVGDDLYLWYQGEGRDVITDAGGTDTLRFGPGLTLDSVAARMVQVDGQTRVFIAVLDVDGQETEQGIELVLGVDGTLPVERFEFADGRTYTLDQLMVTSRHVDGTNKDDTLVGDRRDDTIDAGNGQDAVYGRSGHDVLIGGNQVDRLFGEGGNDRLYGGDQNDLLDGGAGHDVLDGGNGDDDLYAGRGDDAIGAGNGRDLVAAGTGADAIQGGNGEDVIVAGSGNDSIDGGDEGDFIDAGEGDDTVVAGHGADFVAGGRGNDRIDAGSSNDVIAFNRGDGVDTYFAGTGSGGDTLSLGGGVRYADLSLERAGNDLVLELGAGDRCVLKDWYAGAQGVSTLQLVVSASGDYDAASGERLRNDQVVSFDFRQLASQFDAARAADAGLSAWSVSNGLDAAYLTGSNTQAIGGDLTWRYATAGGYGDLDEAGVRNRLVAIGSNNWQGFQASTALDPWTALQAGLSLMADPAVGLPSPLTPMAAPAADDLVFAAFTASGQRPAWLQQPTPQP